MSANPSGKRERRLKYLPPPQVDLPAALPLKVIQAIQNLGAGEATAHQQKMALQWIILEASASQHTKYRRGGLEGDRDTAFACGRAFVGEQIVGALKIDIVKLVEPAAGPMPEPNN